jgi:hypothetical protein
MEAAEHRSAQPALTLHALTVNQPDPWVGCSRGGEQPGGAIVGVVNEEDLVVD